MGLRVAVAAIAVMLIAAGQTASGQEGPMCGNGICEPGEEGWCPDCQMGCNYNGYCDPWENPSTCPDCQMGACCGPAGDCMYTSQYNCYGTWQGPGSFCGMCPPPMGACCRQDGTCMQTDPGGCYDGQWLGPGSSCGQCMPVMGACCRPDGMCDQTPQYGCSGTWMGPGSPCGQCPQPTGACCGPAGDCREVTSEECSSTGGTFQGQGSNCYSVSCPRPMEGCCMPDGTCREVMMGECSMMGGTLSGSSCGSANCPQPGACCFGPGECIRTVASECAGEWLGEGRDCQECQGPIGPCCLGSGNCLELTMKECMSMGGMSIAMCGPVECPGRLENNPIPPWQRWNCPRPEDCLPPGVFELGGPSGRWYEPNVAYGYVFNMTEPNNALFTKILDFPTGFDGCFTIDANNVTIGSFGPGDSVDFVALLGGGVKEFYLTGVSPLTDPEDGQVFPIKLEFNVLTAQFHMVPLITIDMDRDKQVNLQDYSQFAIKWSSENCTGLEWCGGADFDHDGDVGIKDLAIFADYWLWKLEF